MLNKLKHLIWILIVKSHTPSLPSSNLKFFQSVIGFQNQSAYFKLWKKAGSEEEDGGFLFFSFLGGNDVFD